MLDLWSVYLTFTEWCYVGLVICIWHLQNDAMLDSWYVYLTFTEWCHVGLMICVSDIIQNGFMLDSWSVHLTLYRMTACRSRDLCIWHYTEWIHVGLVIYVSGIIQNDVDSWSVYLTLYRMMLDLWSVYLTLYRMDPCWTCDLCIWHYTEWIHEITSPTSFCIMPDT